VVALEFPAMFERAEAGDRERPCFETGSELEIFAVFPEGEVGVLENVRNVGSVGDEGPDLIPDQRLVLREKPDKLGQFRRRCVRLLIRVCFPKGFH
jgi:hypothetical protein